jgi:hypothetical protein
MKPMQNKHIQHPEDSILTGDLSVLNWFTEPGNLSVKIDGAPAIVWGTNPANGKFFVGTKSVFNKVKIKIAHSHEEIVSLYEGEVESILHVCFNHLPRTDSIIQGDFVGLGGLRHYKPNTITYVFDEIVNQVMIMAPHTEYTAENDLRNAVAKPLNLKLESDSRVLFVQPEAYILHDPWNRSEGIVCFDDINEICNFARQMSSTVSFVDDKKAMEIKKQINTCIRSGVRIEPEDFDCDLNLIRFWSLIKSIKEDCLFLCRNAGPEAYLGCDRIDSEGYVFVNRFGTFKLVNREVFSYHNFNSGKFQCAS